MEGGDVWLAWVVNAMYRPVLGRVKSVIPGMEHGETFCAHPPHMHEPQIAPLCWDCTAAPKGGVGSSTGL